MAESSELERDLRLLEVNLRKLETEYNMFFAGTLPRPPVETRAQVERLFRRYDRVYIQSYAERFRLNNLQARFSSFANVWDRGIRAREEGRPGPFHRAPREGLPAETPPAETPPAETPPPAAPVHGDRVLCVARVGDPAADREKLRALHESLLEARRATGNDEALPFNRFAQLVKSQLSKLHQAGHTEVAFRVAVKDNKVAFTARAVKGDEE